jgi:hypothetical protein
MWLVRRRPVTRILPSYAPRFAPGSNQGRQTRSPTRAGHARRTRPASLGAYLSSIVKRRFEEKPARLYVGFAAPGKGPKLIFLRALISLLAAAQKEASSGMAADPYMTALCYFNALRELGGARRIVEDEVFSKLAAYGDERRRVIPQDQPFANRRSREVLEITSRESTDKCRGGEGEAGKRCVRSEQRGRRACDKHDFCWPRYLAFRSHGRPGAA